MDTATTRLTYQTGGRSRRWTPLEGDRTGQAGLHRLTRRPADVEFGVTHQVAGDRPQRVLVMVSRLGHCLNDLLLRWRSGSLGGELVAVVSEREAEAAAAGAGRRARGRSGGAGPLHAGALRRDACRPARPGDRHPPLVPAGLRRRQAPPPGLRPGGVELVGATAHHVTPDLDEGPIVEQEVIRIDHTHDPRALATVGRDAEALAPSRAARWHCEQRVLLNGGSTVVVR